MGSLILMMGVPGSGKTTYAKKIAGNNDIYISRDEIRFDLVKENEPYFSKEDEVLATFIRTINNALPLAERYVIADATHLNIGSRAKILKNLHNKPDSIYVIYVAVSLETALKRNAKREGRALVPETAIKNMYRSITLPRKEEGIDMLFWVDENEIVREVISYKEG